MNPFKFHPFKIIVQRKKSEFYADSHCTLPTPRGPQPRNVKKGGVAPSPFDISGGPEQRNVKKGG